MNVLSDAATPPRYFRESEGNEPPSLSLVIPAYNEEARLRATLTRLLDYFAESVSLLEILVVSDGSTDATEAIVAEFTEIDSRIQLLNYGQNRGKGYAVRYGMIRAKGERILFMDADLATPIEEIVKLNAKLDAGFDIAIGSRDVVGSKLEKRQSFLREFGGRLFNKLVQLIAVPGIHDTQCGFKMFTSRTAQAVFSQCRVEHFAFDVEVLYLALRVYHLRVAEVPVRWAHQEGSKVRFVRDAIRMVKTLFRIRTTAYSATVSIVKLPQP